MRSFGTEISGNRPRGSELSETTRIAIIYSLELGQKPTQIAQDLRVARTTVYNTENHFQTHGNLKTNPRLGRPPKLTLAKR
jgi:transposase